MTDRIRRSIKRTDSLDSDYLESDETPVEGQRAQLNLLASLNIESSELVPVWKQNALGRQRATQGLINPLTWLINRELYETRVNVFGCEFNLKQLRYATQNFRRKMEIQRGRSGGVLYKADLAPNQSVVVEKIHHGSNDIAYAKMVRKELEHDNIVKLLDSCSTKSLHLMIYEYMENGSLQQALLEQYSTKAFLDWKRRYNICLGVARGLRHLHDNMSWFTFAHETIKASNIMIDGNFNAKLTEFISGRLLYDDHDPFRRILERIYMAPEHALGNAVTPQADVYSLGIVLLEIVSGRCCEEFRLNQEADYLLDELVAILHAKGRILELVDRRLHVYDMEQALVIINLAMMCIAHLPSHRPTMTEVVKVLEGQKTIEEISKGQLDVSRIVSESRGLIQPSGELIKPIQESESGKEIIDFDSIETIHDSKVNEPTQDPTPLSSTSFQPMENFSSLTKDETLVNHEVFNSIQDRLPSGINASNQDMVSESIHIEIPLKINSLSQNMDPTDLDTSEVISIIHVDSSSLNPEFSTFMDMLKSSQLDLHNSRHVSQLLNFINEELTKHPRDDLTPILEFAKINLTNLQQVTPDSRPIDLSTNSDITISLEHSNLERSNAQSRIATLKSEVSRLEAELAATKRKLQEEEESLHKLEVETMELQNKRRLVSSYQMADVYVTSLKSSLAVIKSFY